MGEEHSKDVYVWKGALGVDRMSAVKALIGGRKRVLLE
jgi:hypothetical protein